MWTLTFGIALLKMDIRLKRSFKYVILIGISGMILLLMMTQSDDGDKVITGHSYKVSVPMSSIIKFKEIIEMNDKWVDDFQRVTDDDSMLIYSAYADGQTKLRVIGITNETRADVYCLLWYNHSKVETRLVKAYIAVINENHGKRHTAAYFVCYLCDVNVPDAVSIVKKSTIHFPRNVLPVHINPHLMTRRYFTMCLSPMHSFFNDSLQVIEWIELNKMLGVRKFIVYVKSVSNDVKKVLNHYTGKDSNGVLTVLPWSLSDVLCDDVILHYCGQLAALNDCLHRNKGYSYYTAATDLDEFIIPYHESDYNWADMLLHIPEHSVYLFRNSFVKRNHEIIKSVKGNNPLMIDYTMRDDFIYGPRDRSKMIVWTDDVLTLGIHNVWAMRSGNEHGVDPQIGLLHHYRKSSVTYPEGVTITSVKSNATMKYSKELKTRVSVVLESLRNVS